MCLKKTLSVLAHCMLLKLDIFTCGSFHVVCLKYLQGGVDNMVYNRFTVSQHIFVSDLFFRHVRVQDNNKNVSLPTYFLNNEENTFPQNGL